MVDTEIFSSGWLAGYLLGASLDGVNIASPQDWTGDYDLNLSLFDSNFDTTTAQDAEKFSDLSGYISGTSTTVSVNPTNAQSAILNGDGIYIDNSDVTTTVTNVNATVEYVVFSEGHTDRAQTDEAPVSYGDIATQTPSNEDVEITLSGGELASFDYTV